MDEGILASGSSLPSSALVITSVRCCNFDASSSEAIGIDMLLQSQSQQSAYIIYIQNMSLFKESLLKQTDTTIHLKQQYNTGIRTFHF